MKIISYTALASGDPFEGQQIGIALIGSFGTQVIYDHVRLEGPTPTPSNNFSDWVNNFDLDDLNGFGDDPDGDDIDNGLENYFGTSPEMFSQGLVPGTLDGNTFTFTHPLNATPADDITAGYRWSTDLMDFYDDGESNGAGTNTVEFVKGTPTGGMVRVTATISGDVISDRLFVAVEVTRE